MFGRKEGGEGRGGCGEEREKGRGEREGEGEGGGCGEERERERGFKEKFVFQCGKVE